MTNQEEIELETVEAQYWVDQKEALERLEKNEDFKKVIIDGYIKERSLDQVSLLSADHVKSNGLRPDIMEALVAISTLQYHFKMVKNLGSVAEQELSETYGPDVEE